MTDLANIRTVYTIMERHGIQAEFYTALNFATEVVTSISGTRPEWQKFNPAILADIAAATPAVREAILADKKILAIKELRQLTTGGLRECKEAVEAVADQVRLDYLRNKLEN
jgi:hypothetical protein